jgi:type III secretion protein U
VRYGPPNPAVETRGYEASAERLARARARFGRPGSHELTSAAVLAALAIALPGLGAGLHELLQQLWSGALGAAQGSSVPALGAVVMATLRSAAAASVLAQGLGLLVAVTLAGWVANTAQRGGWLRALAGAGGSGLAGPQASALPQPTAADRRIETSLTLAKWLALSVALLWPFAASATGLFGAWQRSPAEIMLIVTRVGSELLARAALVFGILGVLDLGVQRWLFRRRLRMSRSEWRQERRAGEADPLLVGERRRRAQELRAQATLEELAEAALLLSDGHGALLAFRHDPAARVLVLWIKAEAELAVRLSAAARAREIPLVRDPGLANALKGLEIGESPDRNGLAALSRYIDMSTAAQEREHARV